MKQYYCMIDTTFHTKRYWHGDNTKTKVILSLGDLIIPLGTKKPKNVSRETIREF